MNALALRTWVFQRLRAAPTHEDVRRIELVSPMTDGLLKLRVVTNDPYGHNQERSFTVTIQED
jgi:hypothetical protein